MSGVAWTSSRTTGAMVLDPTLKAGVSRGQTALVPDRCSCRLTIMVRGHVVGGTYIIARGRTSLFPDICPCRLTHLAGTHRLCVQVTGMAAALGQRSGGETPGQQRSHDQGKNQADVNVDISFHYFYPSRSSPGPMAPGRRAGSSVNSRSCVPGPCCRNQDCRNSDCRCQDCRTPDCRCQD